MKLRILHSSAGFTYVAVIVLVTIMGIMLAAMGESMHMVMKREREEELLFRGNQIRQAIARWYIPRGGQNHVVPLGDLKDLLKDPRSLANVKYLPRLYKDPMSDKDWEVVKDGQHGGIIGVFSSSEEEPAKKANFPVVDQTVQNLRQKTEVLDVYKQFEGKTKYSEWKFVYGQIAPAGTIKGL